MQDNQNNPGDMQNPLQPKLQPQAEPLKTTQPIMKVAPVSAPAQTPVSTSAPTTVPTPTPAVPAAVPIVEDKPIDPSQLMFKTMPKGFDIPKNYVKPAPAAPLPPQPVQSASGAPRPANSSYMVAPQGPVTPSTPNIQEDQSARGGSSKTLWITLAVVLVLLIAAGAVWYFMFYNKTANTTTATSPDTQVATNTTPTETAPSTTPIDTGTAIPAPVAPVSGIDSTWMQKYFSTYLASGACPTTEQSVCGDAVDPDQDGLTNLQEFKAGTNPTLADTDGVGIADGDAVNIFNLNPTTEHTGGNPSYTDAQDLQDKYNSSKHASFTDADLVQIAANIAEFKLHQPTIATLGPTLVDFYTNYTSMQNSGSSQNSTSTPQTSQTQPSQ
jgi:hypothetical protein